MALNTSKCNAVMILGFKGLTRMEQIVIASVHTDL